MNIHSFHQLLKYVAHLSNPEEIEKGNSFSLSSDSSNDDHVKEKVGAAAKILQELNISEEEALENLPNLTGRISQIITSGEDIRQQSEFQETEVAEAIQGLNNYLSKTKNIKAQQWIETAISNLSAAVELLKNRKGLSSEDFEIIDYPAEEPVTTVKPLQESSSKKANEKSSWFSWSWFKSSEIKSQPVKVIDSKELAAQNAIYHLETYFKGYIPITDAVKDDIRLAISVNPDFGQELIDYLKECIQVRKKNQELLKSSPLKFPRWTDEVNNPLLERALRFQQYVFKTSFINAILETAVIYNTQLNNDGFLLALYPTPESVPSNESGGKRFYNQVQHGREEAENQITTLSNDEILRGSDHAQEIAFWKKAKDYHRRNEIFQKAGWEDLQLHSTGAFKSGTRVLGLMSPLGKQIECRVPLDLSFLGPLSVEQSAAVLKFILNLEGKVESPEVYDWLLDPSKRPIPSEVQVLLNTLTFLDDKQKEQFLKASALFLCRISHDMTDILLRLSESSESKLSFLSDYWPNFSGWLSWLQKSPKENTSILILNQVEQFLARSFKLTDNQKVGLVKLLRLEKTVMIENEHGKMNLSAKTAFNKYFLAIISMRKHMLEYLEKGTPYPPNLERETKRFAENLFDVIGTLQKNENVDNENVDIDMQSVLFIIEAFNQLALFPNTQLNTDSFNIPVLETITESGLEGRFIKNEEQEQANQKAIIDKLNQRIEELKILKPSNFDQIVQLQREVLFWQQREGYFVRQGSQIYQRAKWEDIQKTPDQPFISGVRLLSIINLEGKKEDVKVELNLKKLGELNQKECQQVFNFIKMACENVAFRKWIVEKKEKGLDLPLPPKIEKALDGISLDNECKKKLLEIAIDFSYEINQKFALSLLRLS